MDTKDVNVELAEQVSEDNKEEDADQNGVVEIAVGVKDNSSLTSSNAEKNDEEAEGNKLLTSEVIKELLPWISIAVLGFILLIVAVVLLVTGGSATLRLNAIKLPNLQGSMKVESVDGKKMRYTKKLSYIGSMEARTLRRELEPKIMDVYKAAELDVAQVVILSFKYGAGGTTLDTTPNVGRTTSQTTGLGIIATHWVYLKEDTDINVDILQENVTTAAGNVPNMVIDTSSVGLHDLTNLTAAQALQVLSQYGFFKKGLTGLDLKLLNILGLGPDNFGVQAEGDTGFCPSLDETPLTIMSPSSCKDTHSTYLGMKCYYSCPPEFELRGAAVRVCLSTGLWSGSPSYCAPKCPTIYLTSSGSMQPPSCSVEESSVGDMCFVQCPSSYALSNELPSSDAGSYFRECLQSGEWSSDVGFCKARCVPMMAPENGMISPSACLTHPIDGEACVVKCSVGYVLASGGESQQIFCGKDGLWSGEMMRCKKTCPSIVTSSDQSVMPPVCEDQVLEGTACTFMCDNNFLLEGSEVSVCQSNGTWSKTQPTCEQVCSTLPQVKHGIILSVSGSCFDSHQVEGSECLVDCDSGFFPSAASTQCNSGTWTEDLKCHRMCPNLEPDIWVPASCSQDGHHQGAADCSLNCPVGKTDEGSNSLTCDLETGKWSNKPGTCLISCPSISDPTNGGKSCTSETSGGQCTFFCNNQFQINGTRVVTCQDDGQWSASAPTCSGETQYVLLQNTSSHVACLSINNNNYLIKASDSACDKSVERSRWSLMINSDVTTRNVKNVYSGECISVVSTSSMHVTMAECDANDTSQHFSSDYQTNLVSKDGNYLVYGYSSFEYPILSPYMSVSTEEAQWVFIDTSDDTSYSIKGLIDTNHCLPLPARPGMSFDSGSCTTTDRPSNFDCDAVCPAGQELYEGSTTLIKCTNGIWHYTNVFTHMMTLMCQSNTASPSCEAYSVPSSVTSEPAACVTTGASAGTICSFSCANQDKYLQGPSTLLCTKLGNWFPLGNMQCQPYCSSLNIPAHSQLVSTNSARCINDKGQGGDTCMFVCDEGYHLNGSHTLTCLENGDWTSAEPTCVKVCPVITADLITVSGCDNMTMSDHVMPGASCTLSCPIGYETEVKQINCLASGMWDHLGALECKATCMGFATAHNYTLSPSECEENVVGEGVECAVGCNEGQLISASLVELTTYMRMCGSDGIWSGDHAVCGTPCGPITPEDSSGYFMPESCSRGLQRPGTICTLHCQSNMIVQSGTDTVTCGEDGTWEFEDVGMTMGFCMSACEPLADIPHAEISPSVCSTGPVTIGTECAVICPIGMDRVGPGVRMCLGMVDGSTDSVWSGKDIESKCVARCPPVFININTYVSPQDCAYDSQLEGAICSFDCAKGLTVVGDLSLQCMSDGQWSSASPICERSCVNFQIDNGVLDCGHVRPIPAAGYGYVYMAGTKCSLICNEGYTPVINSEVTCSGLGSWLPDPYCKQQPQAFTVVQKIENSTKCLAARQNLNMQVGEWDVGFLTDTDSCIEAGNAAMWYWHEDSHLRHMATGLCLSSTKLLIDTPLTLKICDSDDILQWWNCDAHFPYRFLLKDTDLSIDSSYEQLGPLLQTWTHEFSFWIIFNNDLETTASLCSFKSEGICPGINIPGLTVKPDACLGDEIETWQECTLSCDEGVFSGTSAATECLPTGVWSDIDDARCAKKCPPLPSGGGKLYDSASCTSQEIDHNGVCKLLCAGDTPLSNGEYEESLFCSNGVWEGDLGATCASACPGLPETPDHSNVTCIDGICRFHCDPGYIKDNETTVVCLGDGTYSTGNFSCSVDFQFMIIAMATVESNSEHPCLSVSNSDGGDVSDNLNVMKMNCDSLMARYYWRWNGDMIQDVFTGLCLTAADTDRGVLTAQTCNMSSTQLWTCTDQYNPNSIVNLDNTMYVDYGMNSLMEPVLSVNTMKPSSKFMGYGPNMNIGSICSFRQMGYCPPLTNGPGMMISPATCTSIGVNANTTCTVTCDSGFKIQSVGTSSVDVTCLSDGSWDRSMTACVAENLLEGVCSQPAINSSLVMYPPNCENGEGLHKGFGCYFSCMPGSYLVGVSMVFCKSTDWSADIPTCKALCTGINTPVTPPECSGLTVLEGTACTQTCEEGYMVDGDPVLTCQSNGIWSGTKAKCKRACPLLSSEPYLATSDDSLVIGGSRRVNTSTSCASEHQGGGSHCNFSCPGGLILVSGDVSVECGETGDWLGTIPICVKEFTCPEATSVGATVTYSPLRSDTAVVPGTAVFMDCDNGYTEEGDSDRICQSNGQWGGNGPSVPVCEQLCPPLLPVMFATFDSEDCLTMNSANAQTCTATCVVDTELENGDTSATTTCNNGAWSNTLSPCRMSEDAAATIVEKDAQLFLLITRSPVPGCFHVDEYDTMKWRGLDECSNQDAANVWKWKGKLLYNVGQRGCVQPINMTDTTAVLGLSFCNDADDFQHIQCGDPMSANQKNMLRLMSNEIWRMEYSYDAFSGSHSNILLYKVDDTLQHLPREVFSSIEIQATTDIFHAPNYDRSVCGFSCGGRITQEVPQGYFVSPGYYERINYLPYSNCFWLITGEYVKITLTLLELDMEGNADLPCTTDCLKVYRGDGPNTYYSDLVITYTGDDITKYADSNKVVTVMGAIYVSFTSNEAIEKGGFVLSYEFEEVTISTNTSECGVTTYTAPPNYNEYSPTLHDLAPISKWPWLVSIRETVERIGTAFHRCTGVLIDQDTVVSAAHCARFAVLPGYSKVMENRITAGLGRTSQYDMDMDIVDGNVVRVNRVFIHPEYDYATRLNDIAVWKLSDPIPTYSNVIQPICAPFGGYPMHDVNSECFAAGWTQLENGVNVVDLVEYRMKMNTAAWCDMELGLPGSSNYVCAGNAAIGTTGTIDSEPLMCRFNGVWYLAGVASYTDVGSRMNRRLYTNVDQHKNWLLKTLYQTSEVYYTSMGLDRLYNPNDEMPDENKQAEKWFQKHA